MKVRKDSGFTKEQNRTIDDGEFACMPGSHKANYACPDEVRLHNEARERIVQIPANAGDAVIFVEYLMHGALPWTASHQRRMVP